MGGQVRRARRAPITVFYRRQGSGRDDWRDHKLAPRDADCNVFNVLPDPKGCLGVSPHRQNRASSARDHRIEINAFIAS
jgi:hypothetical protein